MPKTLTAAMADTVEQVEAAIDVLLPRVDLPEARLFEAMRYGCLGGGKRLRPFLVMESARLFGVNPACALRAAAAVEFIHCYSLVHDDLPAMDDSDLRRGRPTLHLEYDEATAILAGDALLTVAFEILADPETHEDAQVRCRLVSALAKAAGPRGMVGGQMLDLMAEDRTFDIGAITRLQRLKTGELIAFSATAGAILGRASPPQHHALQAYAHDLGLAFQIADDLLDVEGTEAETGKSVGRDEGANKATFVSILGVERAREQAGRLADQAMAHLDIFEDRADMLKQVARYVVDRRS
ncbi:geranylgeranyl pyrophosphate synthase [Rhodospirillum centenum SW]|uniref:Geranylgeranyl pyrophosphate synthase n=1 Tax=Rhodospirillum centenum (strain ATCC 51521 / SW) TaxID=414684 RepID=B6IRB4_RHOCS|nr:geranylgeranyl pyrophosphate synthase [Rhodospirillum centenum SW]